jgi:hypothetical protein
MKHNFKTLFILITICLPWGIFAQNMQLPDYLKPYITPNQLPVSVPQERNGMPVLLTDSAYCASFDRQTDEIIFTLSAFYDYDISDKLSTYTETTEDAFNGVTTTRFAHFYNTPSGKRSLIERATKDGTNWILKEKTMYAYDSNDYLAEEKTTDNMNIGKRRNTYVNNSSGFVLESRSELQFNNELKLNNRTIYSRNADNNPTLAQSENYDIATGAILQGNRLIYEYDAAGNTLVTISQLLDTSTSEWNNRIMFTNTYTSNNLLATTELSYPSLSDPTEWEPSSRSVYTYINQIELDSIIGYKQSSFGFLIPSNLRLHQYANGQLIKDSVYTYIWSLDQWNITERNFYKPGDDIYSIAFGITEGTEKQIYNNGTWTTVYNTINEYTDLGNNLGKFEYKDISLNNANILDTSTYCNSYFHNITPVSTNETLHNKSATIAPNPYKTGQTIRCIGLENSTDLTFSLYDLAGVLISEQNFDGGRGLVLPAKVGAGMYIAVIRQGAQRLKMTKIVVVDAP